MSISRENNVELFARLKNLLSNRPTIKLLPDMTGPVGEFEGQILTAVSRQFTDYHLTEEGLAAFDNQEIAMYQVFEPISQLKVGESYPVVDPVTFEMSMKICEEAAPASYIFRGHMRAI